MLLSIFPLRALLRKDEWRRNPLSLQNHGTIVFIPLIYIPAIVISTLGICNLILAIHLSRSLWDISNITPCHSIGINAGTLKAPLAISLPHTGEVFHGVMMNLHVTQG